MSFSFWEKNTFIKHPDVVIIGSGIVGLATAIFLKQKSPSLHVLVLERGMLPYGASTRNAGFACYGSVSELLQDLEAHSEEKVFGLVEKRWKGLLLLRKLLGDDKIGFEQLSGYEVFTADDEKLFADCEAAIDSFNKKLKSITGKDNIYRKADEKIESFGFKKITRIIENTGEGQIDTGQMMLALLELARSKGVEILNGAVVTSIENKIDTVDIRLESDPNQPERILNCKRAVICVNGFAKKFLPDYDVNPARAQVLVTSPVKNLKVKGTFHYDHGYYYFRNVGDRILFGGGRNLDFHGENTEEMSLTNRIQSQLEKILKEMILPESNYTIEMRWSGIMGLGNEKSPIIKRTEGNIFCAVRMGGMGVAIGTLVGQESAEMVLQSF